MIASPLKTIKTITMSVRNAGALTHASQQLTITSQQSITQNGTQTDKRIKNV